MMNANQLSRVSLASCTNYEVKEVQEALTKLLAPWEGIAHFVKPGNRVLLKPNLLTAMAPDKAVTTHPAVVKAVALLVTEAGGEPFYGDSPGLHPFERAARAAGLKDLGIKSGDFETTFEKKIPEAYLVKKYILAQAVQDADCIINLPKLKTHGQMILTGAVKNLFGCVPGLRKGQFHLKMQDKQVFSLMLLDLYRLIKPAISIIDGIVAHEGNGPAGGSPRSCGFLAASDDAVALDTVCADLIGLTVKDVPYLKAAQEKQLGCTDMQRITLFGDSKEQFIQKNFKMPETLVNMDFELPLVPQWILKKMLTPKPVINHKICKKCYECVKICPAQPKALISKNSKVPKFDYTKCIRCFCCQEICPHKAITIHRPIFSRLIG
ncbi:MAG: DUF362 domain-containing protein [bacterium]